MAHYSVHACYHDLSQDELVRSDRLTSSQIQSKVESITQLLKTPSSSATSLNTWVEDSEARAMDLSEVIICIGQVICICEGDAQRVFMTGRSVLSNAHKAKVFLCFVEVLIALVTCS